MNLMDAAKANAIETEEHKAFVDKFKPKKTTDDCYTPPYIYDAVKDWAVNEYGLYGREIVRPFYPGGDYENYVYPKSCVVIDNPPFSILSKIADFYIERNIDFFLFAPGLTVLSTAGKRPVNVIISNSNIIYENGAHVNTAFITNMGKYKIHVSSELYETIDMAQKWNKSKDKVTLPKYEYPNNLITSAKIQTIADKGQTLKIKPEDCFFVRSLDLNKKKGIYGGGFLLSEKAAAEKAWVQAWEFSEREKQIIERLGSEE